MDGFDFWRGVVLSCSVTLSNNLCRRITSIVHMDFEPHPKNFQNPSCFLLLLPNSGLWVDYDTDIVCELVWNQRVNF